MTETAAPGENMELECGVCYQIYNAGRRCPRELRCKHSFCECCLNLLAQSATQESRVCAADVPAEVTIVCPLCRYPTILPDGEVRRQLHVDEDLFERMMSSGVLDGNMSDDEEDPEKSTQETVPKCEENSIEGNSDTDVVPSSRGKRIWRSLKRFWNKVLTGSSSGGDRHHVVTDEDMRDLVLMACMM
ncbi:E3 ubiquitin-protein ligase-like [Sardina pilchardus]|uniref:E3 ubiquitin-protein ligase-like n=1 Tax=Sardina pilchardus TaxID=27697 RepID=UPI002E14F10D